MKKSIWLCLLLVTPFFNLESSAQNSSNKGTEFWVGFMAHYSSSASMYLYITGDSTTTGTVSIPGKSWSKTFSVTANTMTLVQVPSNLAYVGCSDCITGQGIKVESAKKIIVYSHIYYQYRSDATLVLPVQTTGKEYYCMSYEQGGSSHRSQFMIVAKADSTIIKITPTTDLRSSSNGRLAANKTYSIELDEGEVYQGRAYSGSLSDDVTGTHIEVIDTGANAKCRTISVFSGNSWTKLGCTGGFGSGDNLYEQMYPVNSWGSSFVTVPLKGVNSDNLRFMASKDATTILVYSPITGAKRLYLNAGEFDDMKNVSEAKYVISSAPITVAQFSKTQSCAGGRSDPAMTLINPVEQTLKNITLYSSKYEDIDDHYINIVIPTKGVSSFRLDGKSISFSTLTVNSTFSYAQVKVSEGNHNLSASEGFVATAYGFGRYESYGYAAGANVRDLTAKIELGNSSLKTGINICLGTAAEFEGSAEYKVSKYEWDFGDNKTSTKQAPNHTYADTGTYQVRLYTYKTSYDGCSTYDSAFLTVRVSGLPKAAYTTSLSCERSSITFTDVSTPPANELINYFQWKLGSGAEVYSKTASKYYDSAGKYPVQLIVRTEAYCYDTIQDSLVVNPRPVVDFMAEKACQIDSTVFVNLSTISPGSIDSFIWDFGTGDSSMAFEPKYLFQDSGMHEVVLTAFSDSMCTNSFMDTVYKYQNVDIAFVFNDTCQDMTVDFINQTKFNGAYLTGKGWVTSLDDSSTLTNYSKLFDSAGTYSVYYWVEIDSFCRDSLIQSIEIYPLVKPDFTVSNLCTEDSTTFVDKSSIAAGTYTIKSWDVDDGKSYTKNPLKVKYATPGKKDITLTVESDKGCITTIKDEITIGKIDITDIDVKNVCVGTEQTVEAIFALNNDSIIKTGWQYDNTVIFNDSLPKIAFQNEGTFDLTVEITTKGGCMSQFTKSVTIYEKPTAAFTINSVCDKELFTITDKSTIPDDPALAQHQWYYDGQQVSTSTSPSITANYNIPQVFRLIVTSEFGCKDTADKNTNVYDLPVLAFTILDSCAGDLVRLQDQSTVTNGSLSSIIWKFDDATVQSGALVTKQYSTSQVYQIQHIVTTSFGCIDSIYKDITIRPLPVIDVLVDSYEGCEPFSPILTNNSTIATGSIIGYDWNWGDGQSSQGSSPSHIYTSAGSYQIKVRAVSDQGCVDSLTLPSAITVRPLPIAGFSFTPEKPSILESTLNFTDESVGTMSAWDWDFGDGLTSTEQNPSHNYQDTGTFLVSLTVSNDFGCQNTFTKSFFLTPDLFIYIPDVFSPNGDQVNDGFGVAGVKKGIKNYEVTIYNRWGQKLFYTDDHNIEWDGTYEGKPAVMGSYIYDMRFTDYKESRWFFKTGEILLLR
jgi:gliding motility-associated-like protein